jgi:hypothetical protein
MLLVCMFHPRSVDCGIKRTEEAEYKCNDSRERKRGSEGGVDGIIANLVAILLVIYVHELLRMLDTHLIGKRIRYQLQELICGTRRTRSSSRIICTSKDLEHPARFHDDVKV